MKRMKAMLAVALFAAASQAQAYMADGIDYDGACNADGYVLTSKLSVTRMVATPVDAEPVVGIEKIYFGRSCDAFHTLYGKGKWCRANGGFIAEFPQHSFGFARQELLCRGDEAYRESCDCR